jgi:hypothetical protein
MATVLVLGLAVMVVVLALVPPSPRTRATLR